MADRVLIVTDVTAPGGVDAYTIALADAAIAAGYHVEALLDDGEGSAALYGALARRCPTARASLYHRLHDEKTRHEATENILGRFKPSVVHAVCGAPWTTVVPREAALDAGCRLIFTEQYVAPGFTFEQNTKKRLDRIYRGTAAAIAVSEAGARLLTGAYGFLPIA
ncbi:MAG: glycosyltransferase family 4 protein [Deltaproteobacteria bacterium]|nr:glycosyltransferase family 4 protein [Deltaproteobacteria bacterium]